MKLVEGSSKLTIMSEERNVEHLSGAHRSEGRTWYFLAVGLVAAAAVIAMAVLPREIAGVTLVAAALLIGVIGFLAGRFGVPLITSRPSGRALGYCAALAIVVLGSLGVVWTVVRDGDALWLAWALAGVVLAVTASGAWFVGGRSTQTMTSE